MRSLAFLLLLSLVQLWSQHRLVSARQLAAAAACCCAVAAALVWALLQPEAYRRRRQRVLAALRVLLGVPTLLAGGASLQLLEASGVAPGLSPFQAAIHFVLLLAWESGVLMLAQVRPP